jgi:hypothetical protein
MRLTDFTEMALCTHDTNAPSFSCSHSPRPLWKDRKLWRLDIRLQKIWSLRNLTTVTFLFQRQPPTLLWQLFVLHEDTFWSLRPPSVPNLHSSYSPTSHPPFRRSLPCEMRRVKQNAMKKYWRNGGIAPRILDLSTRWRWVASFTPWPLYPQEKSP